MKKASNIISGLVMTFGIFGLLIMPKLVVQAEDVTVSATVSDSIAFSIAAVGSGEVVNGATTNVATTLATTVPFSTTTAASNKIAAHDLTVTTNSTSGYTVYIKYSAALTHTNTTDTIDNLATHTNAAPGSFSAAGTEAFGYTTNDTALRETAVDRFTSTGGNKWAAFTATDAEVAYKNEAVSNETTRVGYQLGVAPSTLVGAYSTTVIYTATTGY